MAKFEVGAVHSPRQTRQCRSNSGERQRREEELRIPEHCQEIHCLQSGLKMVCKHEQWRSAQLLQHCPHCLHHIRDHLRPSRPVSVHHGTSSNSFVLQVFLWHLHFRQLLKRCHDFSCTKCVRNLINLPEEKLDWGAHQIQSRYHYIILFVR